MYTAVFDGVLFIEGRPPNACVITPLDIRIGGIFRSAQLKNLDDVKRLMAAHAKKSGGNAIIDFVYGQKSVGLLSSIFQRDDVNWYGSGFIAIVQ